MKKEIRSKGYGGVGTAVSIIGFILSAVAGVVCAYIFEFFSFEGCPDETNIILGVIVFAVCEFSVMTKRKILSGIQDTLELGEELESKLELMSGVEIISDGTEEDELLRPASKTSDAKTSEQKKEKTGFLRKGKKAEKEEHVHALLREDADMPIVQSAPIPPVQKPIPPAPKPAPTAPPVRSAADPVVQRAPKPAPAAPPVRSAADPVVQRAPKPAPAAPPLRSAADPVVQRAPEPVAPPLRSAAADPVVQRTPKPAVPPVTPKEKPEEELLLSESTPGAEQNEDVFELMFEEATDDML